MSNQVYSNNTSKYFSSKVVNVYALVSNTSITKGSAEILVFHSGSIYDPTCEFDTTTDVGEIICVESGLYAITCHLTCQNLTNTSNPVAPFFKLLLSNVEFTDFEINGNNIVNDNTYSTEPNKVYNMSSTIYMNSGDLLQLVCINSNTANEVIQVNSVGTYLVVQKII